MCSVLSWVIVNLYFPHTLPRAIVGNTSGKSLAGRSDSYILSVLDLAAEPAIHSWGMGDVFESVQPYSQWMMRERREKVVSRASEN